MESKNKQKNPKQKTNSEQQNGRNEKPQDRWLPEVGVCVKWVKVIKKGMTEDETVGWHHRLNGHEFG